MWGTPHMNMRSPIFLPNENARTTPMPVVSRYTCTGLSTGVVNAVVCCRCSLTRVWLTLNATRRTRLIHQKPVCVVYRPWTTPSGPTVNSLLCRFQTTIIMVALCNRADHYIFMLFLSFFSSPNLSGRRLDVCHTATHGVALVWI